jgi:hypothetical protein
MQKSVSWSQFPAIRPRAARVAVERASSSKTRTIFAHDRLDGCREKRASESQTLVRIPTGNGNMY